MPDVHSGKGCTIGTTMTITDKAVPNVVGVDIGCGMYTVNLGKVDIDFVKVDEAAHFIPSGMNVWEGRQERFDLTELACYRELKDTKRLERSLGTLGGGNHFIEIDEAGDGTKYLVIHSGSRNLGKQVAELYQKLAINLDRGYGDYLAKRDEIIRTYKEQGRRSEIQDALKQLHWQVYESETSMPEDLCYLSGKYLEDYLHDVEICQAKICFRLCSGHKSSCSVRCRIIPLRISFSNSKHTSISHIYWNQHFLSTMGCYCALSQNHFICINIIMNFMEGFSASHPGSLQNNLSHFLSASSCEA